MTQFGIEFGQKNQKNWSKPKKLNFWIKSIKLKFWTPQSFEFDWNPDPNLVTFLSKKMVPKSIFYTPPGGGPNFGKCKMTNYPPILPRQLWSKLREFKTLKVKTGNMQLCHTNIYRDNPVRRTLQFLSGEILTIVWNHFLIKFIPL